LHLFFDFTDFGLTDSTELPYVTALASSRWGNMFHSTNQIWRTS